jgi:hypothetical protein
VGGVRRSLVIPARFNGPPASGNGGFSSGRLAALLSPSRPVEVTIRQPVPLDLQMRVEVVGDEATAFAGNELVASARIVDEAELGDPVPAVPFADAVVAAQHYPGQDHHPFPTCFVCGPGRPARDGLELFPGPVGGDPTHTVAALVLRPEHIVTGDAVDAGRVHRHASTGASEPSVVPELVWAALDCPGGWALDLPNRPAVLGRFTARVLDVAAIGEHCVVVGTLDGRVGRKAFARSTAYGADGRELGRGRATWIELRH